MQRRRTLGLGSGAGRRTVVQDAVLGAVLALGWGAQAGCATKADSGGAPAASVPPPPLADPTCEGLYGRPNENSGLDADQCWPSIEGAAGSWTPPSWSEAELEALRGWTLLDPPAVPAEDPYASGAAPAEVGGVCAVVPDASPGAYRLASLADAAEAAAAGGFVTHGGGCGLCSSLEDLAVYAGNGDLTSPVRQCGLVGAVGGFDATIECLRALGFTAPCAQIWAFNTRHTQERCFDVCVALLDDPYHEPDGALNACLQCDEDESGPVFKAVAGRTRRNSGLATALCRPCETVWRVEHGR